MGFEEAAQRIVYTALNGNISVTVYDDVPMLPSGQPLEDFPYVVIGNDTFAAWDTDDRLGANITLTLHIWSRAAGFLECKGIAGEIYTILNRGALTLVDFNVVDCLAEFSDSLTDQDGETRHMIVRYRLTMTQAGSFTQPVPDDEQEW